VQLVFHHVCDPTEGCGPHTVTPATLGALVDWLAGERAAGRVEVRTTAQAAGGLLASVAPVVPAAAVVPVALPNGSLEADADRNGLSDCTQRTVLGTSTGTFARSADTPHGGAWAETLSVTSLTSGDRKVLSSFDPTCAPPAIPGHPYLAGAWYRSDAPVRVVLYYRDAAGQWRFWAKSAPKPASAAWVPATLRSPPAPADATALATGLLLDGPGTASVDDLSLADVG
jgi:hypothetical protein